MHRRATILMITGPTDHLHIVMNDPVFSAEHNANSILVVNISSVRPSIPHDPTCILEQGCHNFVTRQSYVAYDRAVVLNSERVATRINDGEFRTLDPCSEELFARVLTGFATSQFVLPKISRFIRNNFPV